jgi:signal transduction histidine kinase
MVMKTKLLILSLFAIFILKNDFLQAQQNSSSQIKVTNIKINDSPLSELSWKSISFKPEDSITFYFDDPVGIKKKILYRIYLNGILINPEQAPINNTVTFDHLTEGGYIFKIQAHTLDGWESAPTFYQFNVSSKTALSVEKTPVEQVQQQKQILQEQPGIFSLNPMILAYILGAISIILLIAMIFLLFDRKRAKQTKIEKPKESSLMEELADLKYSYKRVKEELKNQTEDNGYLLKQIKGLETSIKNLEAANLHLFEQKERLIESKRQLELLQTQKEELFAHAIHDIKNPASAIKSYLELLNSYDLNATEQQEIMVSLMESSEDIVKLSQEMCSIIAQSKPEPALKFEKGSVKKIIDKVCNQNMSYAKAKKVTLLNKSSNELPDVKMDDVKIEDVIDNLVNNAIKYGPENTTVEVRTSVRNDMITVEVKDNGVGLSEADMKRAFQKGAILSAKPTGIEQSSGLGLWLVKKTIDEHNGKVWVDSKLSIGSTFAFDLPINEK